MRFSAIVLLLSCWTLQPIQAALPEPAPPLKLILDNRRVPLSIAHGGYGTAVLFQNRSDEGGEEAVCTLTMTRKGRSIHYPLPVPQGKELRLPSNDDGPGHQPYWKHILCLGEKGTCLVAGKTLRDLVFVPAENAAADFPNLVPLVRQAWVIGEKNNYFLSFAWTNKARDRLLLLVRQQAEASSMGKKDVLCYLAKGKQPWVIADETEGFSPGVDSLSARALFLKDGSGVFLSRDGKRLICFPAGQDAGYSLPLPGLCKGMSRQGDQDIRLLMQHKSSIFARPLTLTGESAAFGGDEKIAALPEAVSLATPLGEGYWVYPTDDRKLILWSETKGVAAAPLISNLHVVPLWDALMWWQVADDGHGHRRILYCLAANESQSVIGAIDALPATLYQETKQLKKAPLCFPVRGLCGTVGFYVAETNIEGTFYPSPTDGSFFSLEKGVGASIPVPNYYTPEQIKQVACWFCPEQNSCKLYLALVTHDDFELYELTGNAQELSSHEIQWQSRSKMRLMQLPSYENMQWVVNEETESPVLVLLPHGGASHLQTVSGFPGPCKYRKEKALGRFSYLGEGNLVAKTTGNTIHVYRLSVTRDQEMGEKLEATWLFNWLPRLAYPEVSMLLSIQERGIERVLLRTGEQMYCTNFLFKESGETCTPDTEKIEDGHFLLPSAFAAHYIGNRSIGHASDTGGRPCVIVADRQGELSFVHVGSVSTKVVVTGFLRKLEFEVEDLVPDMIRLLVGFLGGAFLALQERTSCRPGLFTWSSHFAPFAFVTHKKNRDVGGKCRALVTSQK